MAAGVRRQAAAAMTACLVTLLLAHGAAARALQAGAAALEPAALPNAVPIGRSTVDNSVQNCLADIGVKGVAKDAADNRTSYDLSRQQMVTRYDRARFVYNKVVNRYPCAPSSLPVIDVWQCWVLKKLDLCCHTACCVHCRVLTTSACSLSCCICSKCE